MADVKNKNELKRRIDLFLDDFSHEEYIINEPFCKETMRMMREFVGHASHLLDCADAKIKKAKRTARNKAIDEFLHNAEVKIYDRILQNQSRLDFASGLSVANRMLDEIAEQMKAGDENA